MNATDFDLRKIGVSEEHMHENSQNKLKKKSSFKMDGSSALYMQHVNQPDEHTIEMHPHLNTNGVINPNE